MVWVLDGNPGSRTLGFAGIYQRERNLRHKAIAGACLEPVEPFERKGCKQIEQRHCLKGQRDL